MVYSRLMRVAIVACLMIAIAGPAAAQISIPYTVVFDQYMTPEAGAQDLVTLQNALATTEDQWLPRKLGAERTRPKLALGILYGQENSWPSTCRRITC